MIVFFGPAGAGKSTQGQMVAAKQGWPWLSAGQLLRGTQDAELIKTMQEGKLVPPERVNKLIGGAFKDNSNAKDIVLDGYPRQLVQAHWLIENQSSYNRSVDLAIVLEISRTELIKRLKARGRSDDT